MSRFAVTVVLSAFLLFLVQPLMGKVVLPWFGGASAVWTTCLLFFQLMLLGGYAWSHLVVRRLRGEWQRRAHLILLGIAATALIVGGALWGTPLIPSSALRPSPTDAPMGHLLLVLFLCVGLPYFALASTGPLLQAWVAQKVDTSKAMRLYAVSNIGSLFGLLAFPVLLEPFWPLRTLAWGWSIGFLVFVVACASVAWNAPVIEREAAAESKLPPARVASWIALAALPSALLMAVTNHLTQDVAPIPFLWVLPLVIYLASFVVTFDSERWYRRGWAIPALWLFSLACAGMLMVPIENSAFKGLVIHCGFLALACLVGHGELVKLRPRGEHLTAFYLAVSVGGALGGLLVGLVAPMVLHAFYELQIFGALLMVAIAVVVARSEGPSRFGKVVVAFSVIVIVVFGWATTKPGITVVETTRDFYGVLRVERDPDAYVLMHGRIMHGLQFFDSPEKLKQATTYYSKASGVGLWLDSKVSTPLHVGAVGLGVGTLAAYAKPGDTYRFYEINPTVVGIAKGPYFTFMRDAPQMPEVVLGDARTSLEQEEPNGFDLLAVDAFSGDSIPTHLLSREAIALYLSHLKGPDSVIALHVSNRYILLLPVVARFAREFGLKSLVVDNRANAERSSSQWVLLSREPINLEVPKSDLIDLTKFNGPLWTDEFTSLWGLVMWGL
ncbi:MAG: spermidine synthase [Archangium sp.]